MFGAPFLLFFLRRTSGGNTTNYARACDPNCIDRPVGVALTGPVPSLPSCMCDPDATITASIAGGNCCQMP